MTLINRCILIQIPTISRYAKHLTQRIFSSAPNVEAVRQPHHHGQGMGCGSSRLKPDPAPPIECIPTKPEPEERGTRSPHDRNIAEKEAMAQTSADGDATKLAQALTVARSLELPESLAKSILPFLQGQEGQGILERLCTLTADDVHSIGEATARIVSEQLQQKLDQARRNRERAAEVDGQPGGNKFAAPFEGKFADVNAFHSGLDARIGYPSPNLWNAMRAEHCERADSLLRYVTSNYGKVACCSLEEWEYVTEPQEGKT